MEMYFTYVKKLTIRKGRYKKKRTQDADRTQWRGKRDMNKREGLLLVSLMLFSLVCATLIFPQSFARVALFTAAEKQ
jgi:hypothetical protein